MSRPPSHSASAQLAQADAHHVQRERVKQSLLYVRRKDRQDSRRHVGF